METNPKTPDQSSPSTQSKDEKLRILAESLTPLLEESLFELFLDRLKSEGLLKGKPVPEPKEVHITAKHSIYTPELDYFIWEANYSNTLRRGWFTAKDKVRLEVGAPSLYSYPIGVSVTGGNNDHRHKYIIPIATLKASLDYMYEVSYTLDYRVSPESRSMYMKGIMDVARGYMPAVGNLRVRDIDFGFTDDSSYIVWANYMDEAKDQARALDLVSFHEWMLSKRLPFNSVESFQSILKETRAYWAHMPDDGGKSIVTKATMMEILDGLENRTLIPGQIQWHIDILQSGVKNDKPYTEMDKTDWINPQKISIARA
jgi:hypothetical protein